MSYDSSRPANDRERSALNLLAANCLPMPRSTWLAALVQTELLDVVGYCLARGWVAIRRGSIGVDAVYLSEQGREALNEVSTTEDLCGLRYPDRMETAASKAAALPGTVCRRRRAEFPHGTTGFECSHEFTPDRDQGAPPGPALAVIVDDPELAGMLAAKSAEIGERIAKAEDEQIKGVLGRLGLDPNSPAIREQVEVEYSGNGRKLLIVNGTPVAWIITEFPAPGFAEPDGPVDYRFTVRVEPYRVAI